MSEFNLDELEPHPFTEIVARVPKSAIEYQELERSICQLGLLNPIIVYNRKILCGMTRFEILKDHDDIEPKFQVFEGNEDQALQLVIDENVARRHLDDSERAMAAARLVRNHPKYKLKEKNEQWSAEIFKIGERSVRRALELFHAERWDLIEAVDNRTLKLTNAAPCVRFPASAVKQIVESNNPNAYAAKIAKETARQARQLDMANTAVKETREAVDQSLKFGVIYIDPPLAFETFSDKAKSKISYPTMTIEELKNLELPASSECALFLWTTLPFLDQSIDLLKHWGFKYRTSFGWHKTGVGQVGYWSRNNLELLLLGVKGEVPAPLPEQLGDQCLLVKQGAFGEKPEVFADMITKMFPDVSKLEMFARKTEHVGEHWYYYGNEVGKELEIIHPETPAKGKKNSRARKAKAETSQEPAQSGSNDIGDSVNGADELGSDLLQGDRPNDEAQTDRMASQ